MVIKIACFIKAKIKTAKDKARKIVLIKYLLV